MDNRDILPGLNQLRYFYFVAKTRSYTKAANELFVSEPAVSMQLRSLEHSLGTKLFNRCGKELKLTECGRVLYDYAEKAFSLILEAVDKITLLQSLDTGSLRLGTAKALAQHLLPPIVSSFLKRYPGIMIVLTEDKSHDVMDRVMDGRNDIGVVGRIIPYPPTLNATPLTRLEMLVAVSSTSKLSQKKLISIHELVDEPLICSTMRAAARLKIEEAFGERGLKPRVIVEVENVDLIKKLVKEGEGYCILSELWLKEEIQRGELTPLRLKEGRILIYVDVIWKKDESLPIIASTFLGFLEEAAGSHSQCTKTPRVSP